jgi:hypothetical protein
MKKMLEAALMKRLLVQCFHCGSAEQGIPPVRGLIDHVLFDGMIIIVDYEITAAADRGSMSAGQGLNLNVNLIYYGEYKCFLFQALLRTGYQSNAII